MPLSSYELEDLHQAMMDRIGDSILPAISQANRTGELPELLRFLNMGDLLGENGAADVRPTRIIVLGDSAVKESRLRSIARKKGFDSQAFEFALGYEEMKHFDFSKLRNTLTYRAVPAGPMPHSTPGKRDAGSAITEMKAHPEMYPIVIELWSSNEPKITNNSFANTLDDLIARE